MHRIFLRTVCFLLFLNLGFSALAESRLQYPLDVAADAEGTIYIADLKLPGVWKYENNELTVLYQASKKFRTPLNAVRCLTVGSDGSLYVGDSATREVYRLADDGTLTGLTEGMIGIPTDIAIRDDQLFVADLETRSVWQLPLEGGKPERYAAIAGVRGLVAEKDSVLAVTTLSDPVRRLRKDADEEILVKGRPFELCHQVVQNGETLYIADNYAATIWQVDLSGSAEPVPFVKGAPLVKPVGLGWSDGNLLVADPGPKKIFSINSEGEIKTIIE